MQRRASSAHRTHRQTECSMRIVYRGNPGMTQARPLLEIEDVVTLFGGGKRLRKTPAGRARCRRRRPDARVRPGAGTGRRIRVRPGAGTGRRIRVRQDDACQDDPWTHSRDIGNSPAGRPGRIQPVGAGSAGCATHHSVRAPGSGSGARSVVEHRARARRSAAHPSRDRSRRAPASRRRNAAGGRARSDLPNALSA